MPSFSVTAGSATANGHSITCGNSLGQVTIKASATSSTYQTTEQSQTFNVTNKDGQWIVFKQGEKGGLRDLPLSRKPIPLGRFATTSSGLPVTYSIHSQSKTALKLIGNGPKARLGFAKSSEGFTGFGSDDEITILVKAVSAGNGSYNAAAPIVREIKIKKPSRTAFFDERRYDERFDTIPEKFAQRIFNKRSANGLDDLNGDGSITIEDAKLLFDSDHFDSDGDGVSNLLERAFGGDSLTNDRRSVLPRVINKKDGKQRLSFLKYQDAYNEEGIEYIVERSTDLRTWTK